MVNRLISIPAYYHLLFKVYTSKVFTDNITATSHQAWEKGNPKEQEEQDKVNIKCNYRAFCHKDQQ
jgi:hypothetical protein